MGVLPLQFPPGVTRLTLGLDGTDTFDIADIEDVVPRSAKTCTITRMDGTQTKVDLLSRLDTPLEAAYYENGGIQHYIARRILEQAYMPTSGSLGFYLNVLAFFVIAVK